MRYQDALILDNLRFEVASGEFVCVVGASGVGKSTLIKVIAGLIEFTGERSVQSPMAIQFQNPSVFPWLTAAQNVKIAMNRGEASNEAVADLLQRVDLLDKSKSYPGQLSGGQIQRIALARCLAARPSVLLMDEPYAALDPVLRWSMCSLLEEFWLAQGMTVVLVTHNIEDAIALATRIVVLKKGAPMRVIPQEGARDRRAPVNLRRNETLYMELIGSF